MLLAFKINVCAVCILVFIYRSNSLNISLTAYYVFVISDSPPFLLLVALGHDWESERDQHLAFAGCVLRVYHITLLA